jgi:SAM-dependent methyltransferase
VRFLKLFPAGSRRRRFLRDFFIDVPPPTHITRRFRPIDGVMEDVNLEETEIGDTFAGRVSIARRYVLPWLDRARRLEGARILEIGCGTGASTIAFAEQGCFVTAVDVDGDSIGMAQDLCRKQGLEVEFVVANATEVPNLLRDRRFDFIIFYASIEHMTHEERVAAIRGTWEMLAPGAFWCITGTPNRLWYMDYHTAYLPFYFWLPDDLAFAYARMSPRSGFRELYDEPTEKNMHHFLRRGRGVSYHEFDLAMGRSVAKLDIVSSLGPETRSLRFFNRWRWKFTDAFAYEKCLRRAAPEIPPAFLQRSLDVLIRKD